MAVLATIAYYPALRGDFIWDDDTYVTNNSLIKLPGGLQRIWLSLDAPDYYPISNTSLWIDWRLWGMNSTGYHVTNLLLHVLAALLIWPILRKLSIPGGFLAALLFAVHPVNVESVAWIAQRKGLLAMIFFLLAILCYLLQGECDTLSAESPSSSSAPRRWYWLSLLTFVLAMLSKGAVAVLPGVLLGIVWWQHRRISRRHLRQILPFFIVAVALTLVNIWFQTHGNGEVIRTGSFAQRLAGAGAVIWFYLANALAPINLMFVYPNWNIETNQWIWWAPLFACLAVTGVLWRHRNRQWARPLLLGWGYFCLALLPVMGFTYVYFMKYSLVADHYAYTALAGVVTLLAAGWSYWCCRARTRLAPIAAAALVVLLCTYLTYRQCTPYSDIIHLYRSMLEKNPDSEMLHDNLGVELSKIGNHQEAIVEFKSAIRLYPDNYEVHNNLGLEFIDIGRLEEGLREIHESLRIKPDFALAHESLGTMFFNRGRFDEAIPEYRQALDSNPTLTAANNYLGVALFKTGRVEESLHYFQQAIAIRPDYLEAHRNLAVALLSVGFADAAVNQLKEAIQLNPDDFRTWADLARAHVQLHQSADAISEAEQAVSLARSAGREDAAQQLTTWLEQYRAGSEATSDFPLPMDTAYPKP